MLTDRFTHAVAYARRAHATQVRKGSGTPYLYHLLAVSSLVIEFGGDEDQAIAGLLHDVVEDAGEVHRELVRAAFGDGVGEAFGEHGDLRGLLRPHHRARRPCAHQREGDYRRAGSPVRCASASTNRDASSGESKTSKSPRVGTYTESSTSL